MSIDSAKYSDTTVTGRGSGLSGYYDGYKPNGKKFAFTRTDRQIDFNWGKGSPGKNMYADKFSVTWTGKIQAKSSGLCTFTTRADDAIKVFLNGKEIIDQPSPNKDGVGFIHLIKGNTYDISVSYKEKTKNAFAHLSWQSDQQPSDSIPMSLLYPPGHYSDANGTVAINNSKWCTRLDSVNTLGNAVTDTFSLLQNKKMLVSAWVKEGGNDCKCSSYVKNNIVVSYTKPNGRQVSEEPMYATGSIIEGWQRYEGFFTVPDKTVSVNVSLNNTTDGTPVYFDDIRIHPFNANMKGFVYHASNLRLVSELDENNFATFYEYDDDGTLTRVKKETERGIKTITETRSAMQKVINP